MSRGSAATQVVSTLISSPNPCDCRMPGRLMRSASSRVNHCSLRPASVRSMAKRHLPARSIGSDAPAAIAFGATNKARLGTTNQSAVMCRLSMYSPREQLSEAWQSAILATGLSAEQALDVVARRDVFSHGGRYDVGPAACSDGNYKQHNGGACHVSRQYRCSHGDGVQPDCDNACRRRGS